MAISKYPGLVSDLNGRHDSVLSWFKTSGVDFHQYLDSIIRASLSSLLSGIYCCFG